MKTKDEYQELEELRRECADMVEETKNGGVFNKVLRWTLKEIEAAQKAIIDERFGR